MDTFMMVLLSYPSQTRVIVNNRMVTIRRRGGLLLLVGWILSNMVQNVTALSSSAPPRPFSSSSASTIPGGTEPPHRDDNFVTGIGSKGDEEQPVAEASSTSASSEISVRTMDNDQLQEHEEHQSDYDQQDITLDGWYRRNNVLLGPNQRRVQVVTTDKSIGGRGVFMTGSEKVERGDIIAHIPAHLILVPSNLQRYYPWSSSSLVGRHEDSSSKKGATDKDDGTTSAVNESSSSSSPSSSTSSSSYSWQSILTTLIWKAFNDGKEGGSELSSNHHHHQQSDPFQWKDWITTWHTDMARSDVESGTFGPQRPIHPQDYTLNEIDRVAKMTNCTSHQVRMGLQRKYDAFENDWNYVKDEILSQRGGPITRIATVSDGGGVVHDGKDVNNDVDGEEEDGQKNQKRRQHQFANLYSLVLSRTANLGPEWNYEMGIIPLHDMLNHPPYRHHHHHHHHQLDRPNDDDNDEVRQVAKNSNSNLLEANVELFCLGDIRSAIGNEETKRLLGPLLLGRYDSGVNQRTDPSIHAAEKQQHHQQQQHQHDVPSSTSLPVLSFSDRDFVIAARRTILPGEELLLAYRSITRNGQDEMDGEEQLWLFLQYGFPFR